MSTSAIRQSALSKINMHFMRHRVVFMIDIDLVKKSVNHFFSSRKFVMLCFSWVFSPLLWQLFGEVWSCSVKR
jgi:hypothetical protein